MTLAPGTPASDPDDPRTVEQSATIQWILAENADKPKPQYSGFLILPDGTLTNDRSFLTIPADRRPEIEAALKLGTDPDQIGVAGYVLILDTEGVPVRYVKVQSIAEAIDRASLMDIIHEPEISEEPIDLASIIEIDVTQVDRRYTKGTMVAIQSQDIEFTNTSNAIEVQVQIESLPGIIYTPALFTLAPNSKKLIKLTFDSTIINDYRDGINTINTIMHLSSNSAVPIPVPSSPTPPPIPAPNPTPSPDDPKLPRDTTPEPTAPEPTPTTGGSDVPTTTGDPKQPRQLF